MWDADELLWAILYYEEGKEGTLKMQLSLSPCKMRIKVTSIKPQFTMIQTSVKPFKTWLLLHYWRVGVML